ncbi:MAG: flagellar motor protein MotB [Candidatus Omnitrophota bacterium]|nr:flagellar motor protein MotB [Candidatus Omnitrophota bacterium]
MKSKSLRAVLIILVTLSLAGCTFVFQKGRRSDIEKIQELSRQVDELNQAKEIMEKKFAQEIADKQVRLEMQDKGLVLTVVGDLLFDSGKATIRREGYPVLDKVGAFLKENVPNLNVGIEGHTDNQPIQHSGWKSNWELSTARALSVLHYLVNEENISPKRLSAIGYGEYRSVASNDTREGRQLNRRVEIVIMPKVTKVKDKKDKEEAILEPQENLK